MINRDYDILHKDLQKIVKAIECRNQIEESRNKLFKKYLEYSDEKIKEYLNND